LITSVVVCACAQASHATAFFLIGVFPVFLVGFCASMAFDFLRGGGWGKIRRIVREPPMSRAVTAQVALHRQNSAVAAAVERAKTFRRGEPYARSRARPVGACG
jgi:hypothetical protein